MLFAVMAISVAMSGQPAVINEKPNTYIISRYNNTNSECIGNDMSNSKLKNNIKKLDSFLKLQYNWNGNGAIPPSEELVNRIKNLLLNLSVQPDVFPTANNSIQIEYEQGEDKYLEFEIFEDGNVTMYKIDNGIETEEEFNFGLQEIEKNVRSFYGEKS